MMITCMLTFFVPYSFIQYNPTSLERSHKHDLLTEVDLDVPIDLILPETYVSAEQAGEFGFRVHDCTVQSTQLLG